LSVRSRFIPRPGDAGFVLFALLSKFIDCADAAAQPRAACAINPHRRPAIDNSKTVSTTKTKTTTIGTTMTTTRRQHDEPDSHQRPPPPTWPCHRQRQDYVNNADSDDANVDNADDDDDNTDNNADNNGTGKTTTTGHENNWTTRTRRRALRRAF
jgi:hypothetical protein